MDINSIKISKLSYKKVKLDYEIPVYMVSDTKRDVKLIEYPIETIKVSIRYKTYTKNRTEFTMIVSSVDYVMSCVGFRNKIQKYINNSDGISPKCLTRVKIGNQVFDKILTSIEVSDPNYLSILRNRKLEEILR